MKKHWVNMEKISVSLGILAHRTSDDEQGVYNHFRNTRYLGSMLPFSEGEPGSLGYDVRDSGSVMLKSSTN